MADGAWPDLSWEVPSQRVPWLIERTRELARRARAFELALEEASAAGEAALSKVAEDLELWEGLAANLWMYSGLGEAKQVAPEDVPAHAEELEKIYAGLQERRSEILARLGDGAAKVTAREAAAKVDDAQLRDRAGELPSFGQDAVDALGAAVPVTPVQPEAGRPATPDEFRQRLAQESKPLPATADFASLLNMLPPPWVQCVFETLGLELPPSGEGAGEDAAEVELTVNSRSTLQKRALQEAMSDELLQTIVFALEEEDRSLLGELLEAGGALPYRDATARYGKDEADGFFWKDRPPSGTVARLRRVGLAFVGTKDGKAMLLVPSDLQARLKALLQAPAEP